MNRLHYLRKSIGVSVKLLEKYTGICASTITYLEKEQRPFRQIHLDKLTSFFNVTSDYLLGRNDIGLFIFLDEEEDPTILTDGEYNRLKDKISTEVIKRNPIQFSMDGGKETLSINETPYVVYRELKGKITDYELQDSLMNKLNVLSKKMTTDELNRTIKFIEEYILKN